MRLASLRLHDESFGLHGTFNTAFDRAVTANGSRARCEVSVADEIVSPDREARHLRVTLGAESDDRAGLTMETLSTRHGGVGIRTVRSATARGMSPHGRQPSRLSADISARLAPRPFERATDEVPRVRAVDRCRLGAALRESAGVNGAPQPAVANTHTATAGVSGAESSFLRSPSAAWPVRLVDPETGLRVALRAARRPVGSKQCRPMRRHRCSGWPRCTAFGRRRRRACTRSNPGRR